MEKQNNSYCSKPIITIAKPLSETTRGVIWTVSHVEWPVLSGFRVKRYKVDFHESWETKNKLFASSIHPLAFQPNRPLGRLPRPSTRFARLPRPIPYGLYLTVLTAKLGWVGPVNGLAFAYPDVLSKEGLANKWLF